MKWFMYAVMGLFAAEFLNCLCTLASDAPPKPMSKESYAINLVMCVILIVWGVVLLFRS